MAVAAEIHLESIDAGARAGKSYGRAVAHVIEWLDEAAAMLGVRRLADFVERDDSEGSERAWHDPAAALPTLAALIAHVEAEDEGSVIRPGPHYLHAASREALLRDLSCYRSILEEAFSRGDRFLIVLC